MSQNVTVSVKSESPQTQMDKTRWWKTYGGKRTILRRRGLYESLWIYFDTVRFLILEVVFSDFSEFELEIGPPFEVIKTGFCLFKCSATLSIFLHRISSKPKCKFLIFFRIYDVNKTS